MQKDQIKTLLVNILTGGVVAGVIFAAYAVFVKQDAVISVSSVATVAKNAERTALIGIEIDYTVRDLEDLTKAVESSNAVFELPAFRNLEDFSVAIPKQLVGRENPFVPTEWKLEMSRNLGAEIPAPTAPVAQVSVESQSSLPANPVPELVQPESVLPQTPSSGI